MITRFLDATNSWETRWRGTRMALCLAAITFFGISAAQGQVILFDFGPNSPSGANLTNSPGHSAGAVTGSETNWNIIGVSDVLTGLSYADGSAATGVSIYTGVETSLSSKTIDFSETLGNSNGLGTTVSSGVYAGDSVGKDGVYHSNGIATGIQVSGLAAGTYEIYIAGRNTNQSGGTGPTTNFYASASAAGTTFDFTGLTGAAATNVATGSWIQGNNYQMFTITLTEGQVINIANDGDGSTGGGGRGFLNSLQIVTIPEPASPALLVMGLGALFLLRRASGSRPRVS